MTSKNSLFMAARMDAFRAFTISDISRAMNNMTNSEVTGSRDFRSMTLNQRCCCRGSGGD